MKFLNAQGQFGAMNGASITFEEGLNVLYLPNEGGKTTLCDFLRIMLYGLNTSKRDSKNQLSDKTRYRPLNGEPMSGLLGIEWKGRPVVLSRQTGKGGLMQEFAAYYADNGEKCTELTSRDCGRTLTGVGEEGFVSSALVDGKEQSLATEELGDRMLSLSSTGDGAMLYSRAVSQMDAWRNKLKGAGGRGRYAEVEAGIEQDNRNVRRLDELQQEIIGYEQRIPGAEESVVRAEEAYQKAYEEFTLLFVSKREEAERRERQARELVTQLGLELPDEKRLHEAETARTEYIEARDAAAAAKQERSDIQLNYQTWMDNIDREEREYSRSTRSTSDIHIRGWSLLLAIACGLLAVVSLLHLIPVGGGVLPYLFSALTVVMLVITFKGSTRTLESPPMDFDTEREKLRKRQAVSVTNLDATAERLEQARLRLLDAAGRLSPELTEEEQSLAVIAALSEKQAVFNQRKREHQRLANEYLAILETTGPKGEARKQLNASKESLDSARLEVQHLHESIASCEGKCEEIGSRKLLLEHCERLKEERENILWQLDAIRLAKEALQSANAELTGRMSPLINKLAQEYLTVLTNNKYTALQLYTNFEASCRTQGSAVEMDRLRLSTGTRDQLYLALRLAVCKVLLDGKDGTVPLILDDPFITYDEERTACGMRLLRDIARERQVILLTSRRPA